MPLYLTRFSYTPATWAKLIKNPEDRRAAAKEYIEELAESCTVSWYAFGDHDGYNLWEVPITSRWQPRRSRSALAER